MPTQPPRQTLFDLDFCAISFREATELLADQVFAEPARGRVVITPNVDHIVRLDADPAFKRHYATADFLFADGMPIVWASRWLQRPLPERVTGSDLFVALCQRAIERQWRVMILGGEPGQEAELEAAFRTRYPGLSLRIVAPSMGFDPLGEEAHQLARAVQDHHADVVFVCLGMPKQERWALHFAPKLDHGIVLCVGAAMEFAIGRKKRAPSWVQRAGLEWLWRLLSDPRRLWRRYLVQDRRFVGILWREWQQRRP